MTEKVLAVAVCLSLFTVLIGCTPLASAKTSGNIAATSPVAAALTDNSDPDKPGGVAMRVLWTVSGYVFGRGASLDEDGAKALLFKPLDINESEIIFSGHTCRVTGFRQEWVNASEYLSGAWKTTPKELQIPDQKLQVIRTDCDIPGFREYMRLSDRRLIVPINGVFFFFNPAVDY